MAVPRVQLLLARHADSAWSTALRPWLERGHGRLERSYVVVATRGQAHGLKQRCVAEGVALLGVEFLSPGLARQKWLSLVDKTPAMGRELLLLELRLVVALKLEELPPDDPSRGAWKSLQSDAERALDDHDELLKAGFRSSDFPHTVLREAFAGVSERAEALGYVLGATQSERAALTPPAPSDPRIGGRLLVYGLTAESWGEFFNVAAFARRFEEITVVLPEPSFRGQRALDENWVELWQTFLGVAATPLEEPAQPPASCEAVAFGWTGAVSEGPAWRSAQRLLVGRNRAGEMNLVAHETAALLERGATDIAIVFPRADRAHALLVEALNRLGVPFVNLLDAPGAIALETQLQHALLAFHEHGGRLDELLSLWPLLRAAGLVTVTSGQARTVCERLFDERQNHALSSCIEALDAASRPEWREVARVARLLLPAWPESLTLAEGVSRFERLCGELLLTLPVGWSALATFAGRETRPMPAAEVLAAIGLFLPEGGSSAAPSASPGFARVTLTTRRRAEGLAWSHLIFTESNAGVWPERRPGGGWLADQHRTELNRRSRFSLGLFTADDRAWLERRSYAALARDTRETVVFSAALCDEAEPDTVLAPNSWLERVLWDLSDDDPGKRDPQKALEGLVASPTEPPVPAESVAAWSAVWRSRRDPALPFDEHFLSADPARHRPQSLPARLIERAVQDPAELWFAAVVGLSRVDWQPLLRSRKRALGQLAHRLIATALQGDARGGGPGLRPSDAESRARLDEALLQLRQQWPADRYWDSFHSELAHLCQVLWGNLAALQTGSYFAAEQSLPSGVRIPLGAAGELTVTGRMDALFLDRPEWVGAAVDIVDFKTGNDKPVSAARMARNGAALQLGVYLAAARALGARSGRVWMIKPEPGDATALEMSELPGALALLDVLGRHLATGRYGALTRDRSEYAPGGFAWPIACTPVPEAVLEGKFAATFGLSRDQDDEGGEAADE